MGRKIPGRKHHGVRDPEKQKATRLAAVANKINAPPKDINDQGIPKSLLRIQHLQEKMIEQATKPKVKKPKKTNFFNQRPGESDDKFIFRVNTATSTVLKEAKFTEKYNVDIIRNKETGDVEGVKKRPKDEIEEYMKKVQKEDKQKGTGKKKKKAKEAVVKLTNSQKKRAKVLLKKKKHEENDERNFVDAKDNVSFGEIVHKPPSLSLPRITNKDKAKEDQENAKSGLRPGKKDLLLKSLMSSNNSQKTTRNNKTSSKTIDKTAKRKILPGVLRKQLDFNQKAAIDAYRKLKADKYKN